LCAREEAKETERRKSEEEGLLAAWTAEKRESRDAAERQ